jgi:hypothetical protein
MLLFHHHPRSTRNYSNLRYISMCKLLQFPSPDDPRPEPPASALSVPQPAELSVTSAASVHALPAPPKSASEPCTPAATAGVAV